MAGSDHAYLSALELRRLYQVRELSPVEVLQETLKRIEEINPRLNAIVTPTPELALAQAKAAEAAYGAGDVEDKPLLGISFSVKDNIPTKGIRTTMGSLVLKDWVPDFEVPAVERLYGAGGVMLGKTNTPEFGWKGETTNRVFGTTRNPWNLERTPGGSSGGAAAAVASGIGPIALGTDGGGSIRIPASFSGVFGFKASFGLIPQVPNGPLETLPHVCLLARAVRDVALALDTVAGPDPRDRLSLNATDTDWLAAAEGGVQGLRIAWSSDMGFFRPEPDVAEKTAAAAHAFSELGCQVEEVSLDFTDPYDTWFVFFATAMAGMHRDNIEEVRGLVDEGRLEMIDAGFELRAADVGAALIERARWTDQMREFMTSYDLLLTPTMPGTAFTAGRNNPESVAGTPTPGVRWSPFTYPLNLTGQPAASVPCGLSTEGLPIGLQLIGRWRDDVTVLRAAAALEEARPWKELRPPIEELELV